MSNANPTANMVQPSWHRCWSALGAQGDGLALMQKLLDAYAEPQRKYHTVQHLSECLTLMGQHLHLAIEPGEVEMALWFHDAIYHVQARDNELRSAEWAAAQLRAAGVVEQRIAHITQHILATRHSALPQGPDQMLLVDIDLSILGAPRPRFDAYERQVREEYAWVPEALFRRKRQQVLAEFLARSPIYNTPALRAAREDQARDNLAHSLQQLKF
ncbi:hypothetical protein [Pseudorhodoferax sp. Leaf267]|uniref:HD domain-containing protein n=1 Tax=Pseudorhodoferax sp. Leaf267 TaxID=1736316 RepID=UPI0006F6EB08|nr:hypothetical protein [Pseudorhodoferax sp. Leaf267]KQP20498.1 hypothetical protein ASF43_27070 [Pseudorhodoferax sp. Leaf267]